MSCFDMGTYPTRDCVRPCTSWQVCTRISYYDPFVTTSTRIRTRVDYLRRRRIYGIFPDPRRVASYQMKSLNSHIYIDNAFQLPVRLSFISLNLDLHRAFWALFSWNTALNCVETSETGRKSRLPRRRYYFFCISRWNQDFACLTRRWEAAWEYPSSEGSKGGGDSSMIVFDCIIIVVIRVIYLPISFSLHRHFFFKSNFSEIEEIAFLRTRRKVGY